MNRLLAIVLAVTVSGVAASNGPDRAKPATPPAFAYDISWMRLPSHYVLGEISAVAVDRRDNVWVLHRPRTVAPELRSKAAPAVVQFDSRGRFLRAWGGPGAGYDWPANEHSLFVDRKDRVWVSGNARTNGQGDDAILAFTADGRFIRQIGKAQASRGDLDTENVKAAADLYVDTDRRELYAADGYGNRRVIVFDSETGRFKRMWGAFGLQPPAAPPGPPLPTTRPQGAPDQTGEGAREFRSVHGVELARDGTLYVSDRENQRVQLFDRSGRYRSQIFVNRNAPNRLTASGLALSPDAAQRWLYVVDFGNCQIEIFERRSFRHAKTVGTCGAAPGQFTGPHLIATDSSGALYVAEVQGRRVQKLTPTLAR